jgi:phosphoenolpyruvate---glycerone phosphotransferase subunit DhaL
MLAIADLVRAVERVNRAIDALRDALNNADRQFGDGDTGMTVGAVVAAWKELSDLPDDLGEAVLALGKATSRATGSSLGGVLAIGMVAAGRSLRGKQAADRDDVVAALDAATAAIRSRSGANPGDKSILDSLLRIREELASVHGSGDLALVARNAAANALSEFRDRESRIGRARMYGAQSAGHDDPGMLAALLMLDATIDETTRAT